MKKRNASLALLSIFAAAMAYGDEASLKAQEPAERAKPATAAYNYPARIETSPWNVAADISFNFWQASQENMELGRFDQGQATSVGFSGITVTSLTTSDALRDINMRFRFKPGFTLGIDINCGDDGWDLYGAYTWFHATNRKQFTAGNFALFSSSSPGVIPTWGSLLNSSVQEHFQFASENWKLKMDILDLDIGRWFYLGRKLTLRPSLGARAAFIRQRAHVAYTNGFTNFPVDVPGLLGEGTLVENKDVFGKSNSWGLGLRTALEMDWALGGGWRFFGNGGVDLLYTRYTSLREETVTAGTVVGIINLVPFSFAISDDTKTKQNDVNSLRTHLDLAFGFGWGTYVKSTNIYIDLSADYQFQAFFDQNMFRRNPTDPTSSIPNGNLYVQGLVATVSVGF